MGTIEIADPAYEEFPIVDFEKVYNWSVKVVVQPEGLSQAISDVGGAQGITCLLNFHLLHLTDSELFQWASCIDLFFAVWFILAVRAFLRERKTNI